ncbi:MAG: class I SAM-dependent methyltransferase [Planctomycetaceae bacterium]|nr:class I SAM-dependent methyltransferase [Planctomycetales bacterium]MCB9924036.1 class I SAM-dependent methyltransferase [Planctomycetaceae bacterium]
MTHKEVDQQLPTRPDLPSRHLAERQGTWLQGARARLLRRADIANRRHILEIGAGWGFTAEELKRRSAGNVVALDLYASDSINGVEQVIGDAQHLPFADHSFDLVFSHHTLLWIEDPTLAIYEAHRVLKPGGVFVAIEPDYGGMMEMPMEFSVKDIWIAALTRAGADPMIGRKLPAWLAQVGFRCETRFLDRLEDPHPARLELLTELDLTPGELARVAANEQSASVPVVHLPYWLIVATKSGANRSE